MKENTKNWRDIGASLFFILVGIWIIVAAVGVQLGTPTHPKPGLFPFLGGCMMVVMSLILILKSWAGRSKKAEAFGKLKRPAILVAGMAVYVALLYWLGYVLSAVFLGVVILRVLGIRSWKILALTSVCMSVGTYLFFFRLLGVELPAGVLEGLWIF